MLGVILLYIMIQMWIFDADKKDRKKTDGKIKVKRYADSWEVYSNSEAS